MTVDDPKETLVRYLQQARDAMVWKLDGLDEYDIRRPLTPTGTNLLGLVKHLASVELGYFGDTFGRPSGDALPDFDEANPNADMWALPEESREAVVGLYRRAWAHAAETFATLDLDSLGRVPWWPEDRAHTSLHRVLVHMVGETNRHAGHADIVRELIDGATGHRAENSNLPDANTIEWSRHRDRVEADARTAADQRS